MLEQLKMQHDQKTSETFSCVLFLSESILCTPESSTDLLGQRIQLVPNEELMLFSLHKK